MTKPKPHIILYSPYPYEEKKGPLDTSQTAGNTITARRMKQIFSELGCEVIVVGDLEQLDAQEIISQREGTSLIVLNAWKSARQIKSFQEDFPEQPIIVVLTGTDLSALPLYDNVKSRGSSQPIARQQTVEQSLERASALVVLQENARQRIPPNMLEKTRVIFPSVLVPDQKRPDIWNPSQIENRWVLAGNIRREKNIEFLAKWMKVLEEEDSLENLKTSMKIDWYGGCDPSYLQYINELQSQYAVFTWKGGVSQDTLWRKMSQAKVFLNVSHEEGGSNALCEAMSMGVPVLASYIEGNVGLLGDQYRGLFPADDVQALIKLMQHIQAEQSFLLQLSQNVLRRAQSYDYQKEYDEWSALLRSLKILD